MGELDDFLDRLPPSLRYKAIQEAWGVAPVADPIKTPHRPILTALALTAALLWGVAVGAVGVVLCLTIVLIPFGIIVLIIAAIPLYLFMRRRIENEVNSRN